VSEDIALVWLNNVSKTVEELDYVGHIDLISKHVNLTGIPGFEVINFDDWAAQCKHEFKNKLLKSVSYIGFKLLAEANNRVMFKTLEKVVASDGSIQQQGIEVLLAQESDSVWRVIQERVLEDGETKSDGLLG